MKLTVKGKDQYINASEATKYAYYLNCRGDVLMQYVDISDLDSNHDHPYVFVEVALGSKTYCSGGVKLIPVKLKSIEVERL